MDSHNQDNLTPAALLEQLVYVDTFMPEIDDPTTLDERLTAELSAFADDSFVFPDEEKPQNTDDKEDLLDGFAINNTFNPRNNDIKQFNTLQSSSFNSGLSNVLTPLSSLQSSSSQSQPIINTTDSKDLLSSLPKVPVPPGAQSSLIAAGLSQTQIDALAALVAQHQGVPTTENATTNLGLNQYANDEFLGNSVNPISTTNSQPPSEEIIFQKTNTAPTTVKIENTGDVDLDKRKRNTAASARFRIKKKLKEQELERTVRELNELAMTLEKKIQTLEMENKLLRNLVVEKGEQRNNEELENLKKKVRLESNGPSQLSFSNESF